MQYNPALRVPYDVIWAKLRGGAQEIIDQCVLQGRNGAFTEFEVDDVGGRTSLLVSSFNGQFTLMGQERRVQAMRARIGPLGVGYSVRWTDEVRYNTGYYEV